MLWICLEKDVCLYCRNARMILGVAKKKRSPSTRRIAEVWHQIEFWVQKAAIRNLWNSAYITLPYQVVWEGLRKKYLQKTNSSIFSCQTLEFKMRPVLWSNEIKKGFDNKHTRRVWCTHRDKTYSMSTVKYATGPLSTGGPRHLVQINPINNQNIKNQK